MTDTPVTPLEARIAEVAQYEANIAMYKQISAGLPSEWPSHLAHLKDVSDKHTAIAQIADLDEVALIGDLWAYDQAQSAIRAEIIEKRKAEAILSAMQTQA